MKVILLEDVKSLGKKGDIVNVSDGYGNNYIIPKKKGLEATARNLNDLKLKKANDEKLARERYEEAKELAKDLKGRKIELTMKVGEGGRTFGSVSTREIAQAAKEQLGLDVDKRKIVLDTPIRELGSHIVRLKLHPEVEAELTVAVTEKK